MELGIFAINFGVCATDPDVLIEAAGAAEAAGWESVWTGEHYVLPAEFAPPSPAPGDTPMLDPFVALSVVAAHTRRLRLGTGVTVVPLHQPLALAKRVASLDRVSRGRFLFGVGVGYLAAEFEALDAPFDRRGPRTMEALAAMRAIWNEDSYRGLQAEPRPVGRPTPPVHFGGYVPATFRRAVTDGHGWYGFALDLPGIEACVAGLAETAKAHARPVELPPLEISVTPHPRLELDRSTLDRLAELGVDRLILLPPRDTATDADRYLQWVRERPAELS